MSGAVGSGGVASGSVFVERLGELLGQVRLLEVEERRGALEPGGGGMKATSELIDGANLKV